MTDRTQHVIDAIDGALGDYAVSDDAMRWSPEPTTKLDLLGPLLADPRWPGGAPLERFQAFIVRGGTPEAAAIAEHFNDPEVRERLAAAMQATWERIVELLRPVVQGYIDAMVALGEQLRVTGLLPEAPPIDVRARALHLHRNRNTGPARPAGERAKRPRGLG